MAVVALIIISVLISNSSYLLPASRILAPDSNLLEHNLGSATWVKSQSYINPYTEQKEDLAIYSLSKISSEIVYVSQANNFKEIIKKAVSPNTLVINTPNGVIYQTNETDLGDNTKYQYEIVWASNTAVITVLVPTLIKDYTYSKDAIITAYLTKYPSALKDSSYIPTPTSAYLIEKNIQNLSYNESKFSWTNVGADEYSATYYPPDATDTSVYWREIAEIEHFNSAELDSNELLANNLGLGSLSYYAFKNITGNGTVYFNTSFADTDAWWTSSNNVVIVHSLTKDATTLISAYLQKYPSDLK